MVLQIIFRWRKCNPNYPLPRILITAPSNAAVDEIVRKLLACRQRLSKDEKFNMMRIGNLRAIHPEVQCKEQKSIICFKNHTFFTKIAFWMSQFSEKLHFQKLILHKIHSFKNSFFIKFTFHNSHIWQNSNSCNPILHIFSKINFFF